MVNTTSKRKRKSHNNRTRLSRRIQKGGVPPFDLETETIKDEATYLKALNQILAVHKVLEPYIDDIINKKMISDDIYRQLNSSQDNYSDSKWTIILTKMNDYRKTRLREYNELYELTKPIYPYARIQRSTDKTHPNYMAKAKEIQDSKNKKTYTNDDYYIRDWGDWAGWGES